MKFVPFSIPRGKALRVALLLVPMLSMGAIAAGPAVPPEVAERLKRLEAGLSDVHTLKVDFTQEKEMAILEQKLVLKGRITLERPDKVAWRVHSPIRYTLVIEGSTLKQWSEDTKDVQQISLAGNPVFKAAIQQLQAWFSGNYLVLAKDFTVAIQENAPLTLRFTPRAGSPSKEIVSRIVMRFGEDERILKALEVEETGGDKMRITFTRTELNPRLSKAEWDVKAHE